MSSRRSFLKAAAGAGAALAADPASSLIAAPGLPPPFRLGLVTYNWGNSWDLPTLIENCANTGFEGIELRSTHAHGVEPGIPPSRRREVAARFADAPVSLVGLGSACEYHSPDPAILKKNIEETNAFVELCHDVGGTGVKVRPNALPKEAPPEKTIEQIGKALNQVADYAEGFGVEIRVEVHGRGTADIPVFTQIMGVANHPNVVTCWNCNPGDLVPPPGIAPGEALSHNFGLLQERIATVHIHDLRDNAYPWKQLFGLLARIDYSGWTLLEEGKVPGDDDAILAAMRENRAAWEELSLLQ